MQNKFSKKLAMIIVTILAISTVSAVIPFGSATITNRPTVYDSTGATAAPVLIEAGTTANIDTMGMTITGAQVWLWLSTTGGSEINTALGDRPYAGPFLLSELVDLVTPHPYTFTTAQLAGLCNLLSVDSPFAGEQRTYTYVIGNNWINGTVPLKVQGEDVDYWIKIADVTPAYDIVPGSEIGVSTNRVHFLPGFAATPLMSAPETTVKVSGYALPSTEEYNVTEDGTTVLGLIAPTTHNEGGWLWTGFETAFNIMDLENAVPFGTAPSQFTAVNITVWEHSTATDLATWDFDQYWREVYLESEGTALTFRGDTGDYSGIVTLNTGSDYDVDIIYFPSGGTASIYIDDQLVAFDVPLNGTGGVLTTITIPAFTTGDYTFSVIDNNDVEYSFDVHVVMVPYITVTPNSGYVGDSFSVTGVNFLDYVDQYVTIYFENSASSPYYMLMLNFTVPSSTWTTSPALTVPNSWGGPRYVEARITDGTTVIADDIYTVLSKIDVIPDVVNNTVCQVIQVVGTGFAIGGEGDPQDYFFYIDNSMYFGDDEDWGWAVNATGYILTEFAAAGFRPGLHVVHVIADYEGAMPWVVFAKDNFIVSTVGDPIVAYLEGINATVSDGMVTLLTTMGEMNITLAEIDATIVALDGTIATLSTAVGNIQVDLTAIGGTITTINGNVATIKTDVGTIKSSLTGLGSISSIAGDVASIKTSMGTVEASLLSLDAVLAYVVNDTVTINTAMGRVETSLDALDAIITVIGDDIVSIETSIGTIEGKITAIEGTLATVETELGTVQVDLASAKTDISSVKTDVDESLPVTVDMTPVWIAVVLALIAAIGSIAGVFIIQRKIAG